MKTFQDKHNLFDLNMVQDKIEKHKYYIMLDGYVVGVQYNLGTDK